LSVFLSLLGVLTQLKALKEGIHAGGDRLRIIVEVMLVNVPRETVGIVLSGEKLDSKKNF